MNIECDGILGSMEFSVAMVDAFGEYLVETRLRSLNISELEASHWLGTIILLGSIQKWISNCL